MGYTNRTSNTIKLMCTQRKRFTFVIAAYPIARQPILRRVKTRPVQSAMVFSGPIGLSRRYISEVGRTVVSLADLLFKHGKQQMSIYSRE